MIVGVAIEYMVNDSATDSAVVERMSVAFERAGDEIKDFDRYLWPRVTEVFETEMRKQFAEQGGGQSGSWEALSPEYAAWKSATYPGQPILQRTGDMMRALTDSADAHAERAVAGEQFQFGTRGLDYPSFHQLGTRFMPARPLYDFSDDFKRDLQDATLAAVREALEVAGLNEFVRVEP